MKRAIIFMLLIGMGISNMLANDPWPEWENYGKTILAKKMIEIGDEIIIGSSIGLIKIDKNTGDINYLDCGNSYLPFNDIKGIVKGDGNAFCCYSDKLIMKYDGADYTLIDPQNEYVDTWGLSFTQMMPNGDIWAVAAYVLSHYDGVKWTHYDMRERDDLVGNPCIGNLNVLPDGRLLVCYTYNPPKVYDGNELVDLNENDCNFYWDRYLVTKGKDGYIYAYNFYDIIRLENDSWKHIMDMPDQFYLSEFKVENENKMWGLKQGKIFVYENSQWTELDSTNSPIKEDIIDCIYLDDDSNIWFANSYKSTFDLLKENSIQSHDFLRDFEFNHINDIAVNDNDELLIVDNGKAALFHDGEFTELETPPYDSLLSVMCDNNNQFWIGGNYLHQVNKNDNSVESFLTDGYIRKMCADSSGNIWCATNSSVLNESPWLISSFNGAEFTAFTNPLLKSTGGNPDNPYYGYINGMATDIQNNIWFGFSEIFGGTEVALFNSQGNSDDLFTTENSGLPSNEITDIAIDEDNNKWIATADGGLVRYDGNEWKVWNTSNSPIKSDNLTSIQIDKYGNKWIGTEENGVCVMNNGGWEFLGLENSGIHGLEIEHICISPDNVKWFASESGIMSRFSGLNYAVENISVEDNAAETENIKVYPNPVSETARIQISNVAPGRHSLQVIDLCGRRVATVFDSQSARSQYESSIDVQGINVGFYLLVLKTPAAEYTVPLVIK